MTKKRNELINLPFVVRWFLVVICFEKKQNFFVGVFRKCSLAEDFAKASSTNEERTVCNIHAMLLSIQFESAASFVGVGVSPGFVSCIRVHADHR